jgi:hypothetical protein
MKKHVLNEHKVSVVQYKEQRKVIDESGASGQKGKKGRQCLPHPLHFFTATTSYTIYGICCLNALAT